MSADGRAVREGKTGKSGPLEDLWHRGPALGRAGGGVQRAVPGRGCGPGGLAGVLRNCLVLPVAEELIFRGAALRLLQPLGKNAAIAGQAVLFAAMHGSWTAKAYALGMGLIFGWAADRAGSLLPGLVLHILNNGIMLADCLAERRIP